MVLIYAWIDTILNRVDSATKCETKLTCWKNWLVEREIFWINEWKKKNCKSEHWFCTHSIHVSTLSRPRARSCTPLILIKCNKYKPWWSTHSLYMRQKLHHICMQYKSQFSYSLRHNHYDRVFSNIFINHFALHAQTHWLQKGKRQFQRNLNGYDMKNDKKSDFQLDWI